MDKLWTNAALRKALGEHGFFEVTNSTQEIVPDDESGKRGWRTAWTRHEKLVYMITSSNEPPRLEDSSGRPVDIDVVGYRNVNTRQPDEGRGP